MRQPDYIAYLVQEWKDQSTGETKTKWIRLSGAFKNRDGSISIPLDGKIILREPQEGAPQDLNVAAE